MCRKVIAKETHTHTHTHIHIYIFTQKSMNFQSYELSGVETGSKTLLRGMSGRLGIIELHNELKHAELAICTLRD